MKDKPYTEPTGGSYVVEGGVAKRVEGTKPPPSKLERRALAAAAQAQTDAGAADDPPAGSSDTPPAGNQKKGK